MAFQERIGKKVNIEIKRVRIENAVKEFCHNGEQGTGCCLEGEVVPRTFLFFFFKYILLIMLLQFSQFPPLYSPSAVHPSTLQLSPP